LNAYVTPQATRVTVVDVNDGGPQQFIHGTGLLGQDVSQMVRVQNFGESSNPPKGAEGYAVVLGGGASRMVALGLEHPQYRPTGLPGGAKAIYDSAGNIIKLIGTEVDMTFSVPWKVVANGVTITSNGADITINAGSNKIYLGPGPYSPVVLVSGPSSKIYGTQ
jgi:phage gp45-like